MQRIDSEVPPAERRKPWPSWLKTTILVILVSLLALVVGGILQDADPGRLMTGGAVVICLLWLFVLATRGNRDLGTDGHGRKEYDEPQDSHRW